MGCATIFQSGPDKIMVNSEPSGARVFLDGSSMGYTPMLLSIHRSSDGIIRVEKEGYEPVVMDRDKVVAGTFFINFVNPLSLLIGIPVDLAARNQGKYSDDPISVTLNPVNATHAPASAK